MKLLTVVISCNKNNKYWEKFIQKNIENLIIVLGDLQEDVNYILNDGFLYLKCNDYYEGLPCKIISLIDAILKIDKYNDITHILKVDDNNTSFTSSILESIEHNNCISTRDYIGQQVNIEGGDRTYHFGKCTPNSYWDNREYYGRFNRWCDGGSSYILSRKAMNIINKRYNIDNIEEVYKNEIYEDVMIANILNKSNIYPHEMKYGIQYN